MTERQINGRINREDMLELTRRMTVKRNLISRIAGAYMDEEGYVDGTFHTHFLKLSVGEQAKFLKIAKRIPFSGTNEQLKEYRFPEGGKGSDSIWRLLMGLRACELKNDALLDVFYEMAGEQYICAGRYGIFFLYGNYDVPLKASDKEELWESEEVYSFMICAICPIEGDYEPQEPVCGFLFPAFKDRSGDCDRVDVFCADAKEEGALTAILFGMSAEE